MSNNKSLKESPSQTAGPYVHIGLTPNAIGIAGIYESDLGSSHAHGNTNHIELDIRVFDGAGKPVNDALLEIWHASPDGSVYPSGKGGEPSGWMRGVFLPNKDRCTFRILKPGRISLDTAPYVNVWVVARGLNAGLNTRVYFPDEDNSTDPVLKLVDEERRQTLVARKTGQGYAFDIHLQGNNETVFFGI